MANVTFTPLRVKVLVSLGRRGEYNTDRWVPVFAVMTDIGVGERSLSQTTSALMTGNLIEITCCQGFALFRLTHWGLDIYKAMRDALR